MFNDSRKQGEAFRPLNTLDSTAQPSFGQSYSENLIMVNEREAPWGAPAKDAPNRQAPAFGAPAFGSTSQPRNPLRNDRPSIFNVPKSGHARTEHHRPQQASGSFGPQSSAIRSQSSSTASSPSVIEIPRPVNFPLPAIQAAPQPLFSTDDAMIRPMNGFRPASKVVIDLTANNSRGFNAHDADRALGLNPSQTFDASNYMDAGQASENIKALLEGTFDDEEDVQDRQQTPDKTAAESSISKGMDKLKVSTDTHNTKASVVGLEVRLLPHQIEGVAWMVDKEIGQRKKNGVLPRGGILADDMGLGKTIQALALILSNRRPTTKDLLANPKLKIPEGAGKATLIVAPLALIKQWESEIDTKVSTDPVIKVLVHHGQSRTRSPDVLGKYDVVITTYQTLTSEHGDSAPGEKGPKVGCFGVHWFRVILDEAHTIKNRNAKMTRAAYDLESVYRWCLTGTPMQNNLDELQSLIRFLRIKPYCEIAAWRDHIGQPLKNGRGGLAIKRLQVFLRAFMKRRTKEVLKKEGGLSVAGDTGSKQEFKLVGRKIDSVVVDFDEAEREFYSALEARTSRNLASMMQNDYIGALVLLLRLRQTCDHPELSQGNVKKDKDSLSTNVTRTTFSTPRKQRPDEEVDDIADMLGAMSVKAKKCDGCGSLLGKDLVECNQLRCTDCDGDLAKLRKSKSKPAAKTSKRRLPGRRIVDSDDEDEGDWLVPEDERQADLGTAGGVDDENDDGGGRWLGNDDSDTDSDESNDTFYSDDESVPAPVDVGHPPSAKIRRLLKILEEESDEHKFIVFSEFTSMLDLVEPFLKNAGFVFTRYDGSMRNDDREASLNRLRNDGKTRILLCSLKCGSLGLNLTAASRVVIMEPFWNPFVEEQAIDRVHRLNQTRDVVVYRLTVADTVEQRILDLQEAKRKLALAALEGGKAVAKLSMQDILRLFKRGAEQDDEYREDTASLAPRAGLLAGSGGSPTRTPLPAVPALAQAALARPAPPSPTRTPGPAPAFTIPKSMQGDYAAYRREQQQQQQQVWAARR